MDNNTASPHGVEGGGKLDMADKIEQYADTILKASGSALRHYTMQGARDLIIFAVWQVYKDAYDAGAAFGIEAMRQAMNTRSLPTGGDDGTV
jgi:hypothetical protein